MIEPITDLPTASIAIANLIRRLPEALANELIAATATPVPAEQLMAAGELLYARRATLSIEDAALAAELLDFSASWDCYALGRTGRGPALAACLRRGGTEVDDPEELKRFAPPPPAIDDPAVDP